MRQILAKSNVTQVRQGSGSAIATNAITTALRFDRYVLLHLWIPVRRITREGVEGNAAHRCFGGAVTQLLARIDDLGKTFGRLDPVSIKKLIHTLELFGINICQHRI